MLDVPDFNIIWPSVARFIDAMVFVNTQGVYQDWAAGIFGSGILTVILIMVCIAIYKERF